MHVINLKTFVIRKKIQHNKIFFHQEFYIKPSQTTKKINSHIKHETFLQRDSLKIAILPQNHPVQNATYPINSLVSRFAQDRTK